MQSFSRTCQFKIIVGIAAAVFLFRVLPPVVNADELGTKAVWQSPDGSLSAIGGELTVYVSPPEAMDAGVRWRVDGGDWQDFSVDGVNMLLAEGIHMVSFKSPSGWKHLPDQQVLVLETPTADSNIIAASFAPAPSFPLGAIPDQSVLQGDRLQFHIVASDSSPAQGLQYNAQPLPTGTISLDTTSNLFTYTAADEDWLPFTVTFGATNGSVTSQEVVISPLPATAEVNLIHSEHNLPDPSMYVIIDDTENVASETFNYQNVKTRNISISGYTLVFEAGNANQLYELLNAQESTSDSAGVVTNGNIKTLSLFADTIIIRSPLWLPGTEVTLYARELRFEGSNASLGTYPPGPETFPSLAPNTSNPPKGADGLPAGNITCNIQRFYAEGTTKRFLMEGGKGQKGGAGRTGTHGSKMEVLDRYGTGTWPGNVVYAINYLDDSPDGNPTTTGEWGSKHWPSNGGDAIADGIPGIGGQGGNFSAPTNLKTYVQNGGGSSAEAGTLRKGGDPGSPNPAHWVETYWWHVDKTYKHTSKSGKDVPAPSAAKPAGVNGTYDDSLVSLSWLHPVLARHTLEYAKDAYLYGYFDVAHATLTLYTKFIDAYLEQYPQLPEALQQYEYDLIQIQNEMQEMDFRLAAGLDYFGNPAGWTPMLSFEVNATAYSQEIEADLPILYLSYWISEAKAALTDKISSLSTTINNAREEQATLQDQFNKLLPVVGDLMTDITNVDSTLHTLHGELKDLEDRLKVEAEFLSDLAIGLHILAGVLKVVPVYQPELGAAGDVIDISTTLAVDYDPTNPVGSLSEGASLCGSFNPTDYQKTTQKLGDAYGNASANPDISTLMPLMQAMTKQLQPLKSSIQQARAPQNQVDSILTKLENSDPQFKDIVGKIRAFNKQKMKFAADLFSVLQSLTALSNQMVQNTLLINTCEEQVNSTREKISPVVFAYVGAMRQRTQTRLLGYQYQMAKAYEYRTLNPYTGTMNLTEVFDQCAAFLQNDVGDTLTEDQINTLKAVYEEDLLTISRDIYNVLDTRPPEQQIRTTFSLSQDRLEQLNISIEGDPLDLNLAEEAGIGVNEEDLRIVDLKIARDQENNPLVQLDYGGVTPKYPIILDIEYLYSSDNIRIASEGKTYRFSYLRDAKSNNIVWQSRCTINLNANGNEEISVTESQPSADQNSLLEYLLTENGQNGNIPLEEYSRPAAFADLEVRVTNRQSGGMPAPNITVKRLDLELGYNYHHRDDTLKDLWVRTDNDLQPVLHVTPADHNSASDGQGNFHRTYSYISVATDVTVEAPEHYGDWQFGHWLDAVSGTAYDNSAVTVPMDRNRALIAKYNLPLAELQPQAPQIMTVNGQSALEKTTITTGWLDCHIKGTLRGYVSDILLNGESIGHTAYNPDWETNVRLAQDAAHTFSFTAVNSNGVESVPTVITVMHDSTLDSDGDSIPDYQDAYVGENPADGVDPTCPEGALQLISPPQGARYLFSEDEPALIPMVVVAENTCEANTTNVDLIVDGMLSDSLDTAPYSWTLPDIHAFDGSYINLRAEADRKYGFDRMVSDSRYVKLIHVAHDRLDADSNGLIDKPYDWLWFSGDTWYGSNYNESSDSWSTSAATFWNANEGTEGSIYVPLESALEESCSAVIVAPRSLASENESVVLIARMSTSLDELVDGGRYAYSPPVMLVQNGQYIAISVLLLTDGETNWVPMPEERLVNNPVHLQIEGLAFEKQMQTYLAFCTLPIVPVESETGVVLQKDASSWDTETSTTVNSNMEQGKTEVLVTRSAVYAPTIKKQTMEEGEAAEGEEIEGEESLDTIAQELLEQFSEADSNGDNYLSLEEARTVSSSLTESQFDALDVDGDGLLNREELLSASGAENSGCGCCNNNCATQSDCKRYLGDWLLIGLSLLTLVSLTKRYKQV